VKWGAEAAIEFIGKPVNSFNCGGAKYPERETI